MIPDGQLIDMETSVGNDIQDRSIVVTEGNKYSTVANVGLTDLATKEMKLCDVGLIEEALENGTMENIEVYGSNEGS